VHRKVDLPVAKRTLELLGEEPFAADLGQRLAARLRAIPGRVEDANLTPKLRPCRLEKTNDELGLCSREG
jgi:hypothetical protein